MLTEQHIPMTLNHRNARWIMTLLWRRDPARSRSALVLGCLACLPCGCLPSRPGQGAWPAMYVGRGSRLDQPCTAAALPDRIDCATMRRLTANRLLTPSRQTAAGKPGR